MDGSLLLAGHKGFAMNKKIFIFLCLAGLVAGPVLTAAKPPQPSKFSVKLTGGFGYQAQSDANANLIDNLNALYADYVRLGLSAPLSGELKPLHWGPDFSAEVVYDLKPGLGVALGVGYLTTHKSGDDNILASNEIEHTFDDTIHAVPVTLAVHYARPLSGRFGLSAEAGLGLYFAQWTEIATSQFVTTPHYPTTYKMTGSGAGLGFQGSVSLEVAVARPIYFVLEATGRYARVGNLTGRLIYTKSDGTTTTTEGKIYYSDWYNGATKKSYPQVFLYTDEEARTDTNLVNKRDARVEVSGFSLRAGVLVRL